MVEESLANLFISQEEMGSVICSLIFKELVSILVLSNYKRNQINVSLNFVIGLSHSSEGLYTTPCDNSILYSLLKKVMFMYS